MKKSFLIGTILLMTLLSGCLSDNGLYNPDDEQNNNYELEEITLSLRLLQSPEMRSVSRPICDRELLVFNTGDLFLVTATGTIVRHYAIVEADNAITTLTDTNRAARIIHRNLLGDGRGSGGVTLTALPPNVAEVVIIGNTLGNSIVGNVNTVGARILDIVSQHNAWNVNLFGRAPIVALGTPTPTYTHEAIFTGSDKLYPTVARIEIGSIVGTEGCIASFRVEGIFIDNYFRNARINGELMGTPISKGSNPTAFMRGSAAYPVGLEGTIFDWNSNGLGVTNGLTVTPGGTTTFPCTSLLCPETEHTRDNVWSYQLFAQQNTASPRIIIRLRDIELVNSDGSNTPLHDAQFLTICLEQTIGNNGITASWVYRLPTIVFNRYDLSPIPNPTPHTMATNSRTTTFTRVMYDFMQQTLDSWVTSGDAPIAWQWQVATTNTPNAFVNIPDATTVRWTIPQDFIHNPIYNGIDVLYFRVIKTLPGGNKITQTEANTLQMYFIRTTVSGEGTGFRRGFGICPQGVRYAVMNRARHLGTGDNTIRVALLNLGGGDHDGGLGSLFQWGRRADGHEVIGWTRTAAGMNMTDAATEANTADDTGLELHPVTGQPISPAHQGRFIRNLPFWFEALHYHQWGNGTDWDNRAGSPVSFDDWSLNTVPYSNNPCPPGWRIPSIMDWMDMHNGTGHDIVICPSIAGIGGAIADFSGNFPADNNLNNNHWETFIPPRVNANGGTIVRNTVPGTNQVAAIFLPAVSSRESFRVLAGGHPGRYWTSTIGRRQLELPGHPQILGVYFHFDSRGVGKYPQGCRRHGNSVRCVAD